MMKNTFVLVVLLMVLFVPVFAQHGYEDVLQLKDGSMLRGQLIRNDTSVCIASGRNLFCYPSSKIKSLTKEKQTKLPWDRSWLNGYYSQVSFGMMTGDAVAGTYIPVSFGYSFNWQATNYYSLGFQTGLETFDFLTIPCMLRNTLAFKKEAQTPYLYLNAGFGFPFGAKSSNSWDRYKSGAAVEFGFAYRLPIRDCLALNFSLGYRYQKLSSEKDNNGWGGGTYVLDYEYNRLVLSIGLSIL